MEKALPTPTELALANIAHGDALDAALDPPDKPKRRRKPGPGKGGAKKVEYLITREGKLRGTAMARILGISPTTLDHLTQRGLIPNDVHEGGRWYDVDVVLASAMRMLMGRIPPLQVKERDWLKEMLWAWDALSLGPWNCVTAPSGRAWRLYLDSKTDLNSRRKLLALHHAFATRQFARETRRAEVEQATLPKEESDGVEKRVFSTNTMKTREETKGRQSMASRVKASLQSGSVEAPIALDGSEEGMGPPEFEHPFENTEKTGY